MKTNLLNELVRLLANVDVAIVRKPVLVEVEEGLDVVDAERTVLETTLANLTGEILQSSREQSQWTETAAGGFGDSLRGA